MPPKKNKLQIIKTDSVMGRPAAFKNNDELIQAIDDYFIHIKGKGEWTRLKYANGTVYDQFVWEVQPQKPTLSGLAYFLGFESRQSFYDYEKNGDYSYTLRRARLHIESIVEQQLFTQNPNGAIFWLRCAGWRDGGEQLQDNKLNIIIE